MPARIHGQSQTLSYGAERQAAYRADPRSPYNLKKAVNLFIFDLSRAVPCTDCGGRYPATCMDFDHLVASTKTTEVSALAHQNYRPSRVAEEMAKCEVVCSNCHRIRTKDRQMNSGTYIVNLGAEPEAITLGEREGRKLRVADNTGGKKSVTRWFNAIVTGRDVETADRLEKGATIALTGQLQQEEYAPKKPRFRGEKVKVDVMPFAKILQVIKSKKFFGEEAEGGDAETGVSESEAPDLTAGAGVTGAAPTDDLPF